VGWLAFLVAQICLGRRIAESAGGGSCWLTCCCCYRSLPLAWWVSNKSHKGSSCRRNAKLLYVTDTVCVWDICTPPLLSHSRVDSLQRLRGYTYTCRLRDGTLHLVTPVWGHAPLYSGNVFGKRYGDVILTSIRPLQREGTRCRAPSLLAPSKVYRLIDLYDTIFMMGVPMLLGTSD
jgi:hypothetical protein